MTVLIAPNIKKERIMINQRGDEIDPKTKRVIKKKDEDVPVEHTQVVSMQPVPARPSALADMIKNKINEKLEKLIEDKIDEALKGL